MQNDRDRLIELMTESDICFTCYPIEKYVEEEKQKLADHILADGWIRLPCKVGETLYLIQVDYEGTYGLSECLVGSKITMLSIMRAHEERTVVYMSTNKTEAEEKLKELEGNK